jgi:hypothetical protein
MANGGLDAGQPLDRAGRDAELGRQFVKAGPSRTRESVTDSLLQLGGCTGTTEGFRRRSGQRLFSLPPFVL